MNEDAMHGDHAASELVRLVGRDVLQKLQDRFSALAKVTVCVCTVDGQPITKPTWGSPFSRMIGTSAMGREAFSTAIAACKYPPEGIRGVASVRAARFGEDTTYLREANDQVLVIIQIETRSAVEQIEDIVALPGVDVAFVGPNDLAANLGNGRSDGVGHVAVVRAQDPACAGQRFAQQQAPAAHQHHRRRVWAKLHLVHHRLHHLFY